MVSRTQPGEAVFTAGDAGVAIGREGQADDLDRVSAYAPYSFAALDVPEPDGAVQAA